MRGWLSGKRRRWVLLGLSAVLAVAAVHTSWWGASLASAVLMGAASEEAVRKPRRVDERQERRLAQVREREARLKRERPGDYPPAPWLQNPGEDQ